MTVKKRMVNSKAVLKKSVIENALITVLFLLSFVHPVGLMLFMILILFLLFQKEIGALKILNIITLRSIINPGIAVDMGFLSSFKLLILMVISIYLVLAYKKLDIASRRKINYVIPVILLFFVYNVGVALIQSSLPIVAIFKAVSYTLAFLGILIGIAFTHTSFNWLKWTTSVFLIFVFGSLFMFLLPAGYLINGVAFQGITNHPNMFGILIVMFIGLFLAYAHSKRDMNRLYFTTIIFISLLMILASASRTSLLSALLLLTLYVIFNSGKKITYLRASLVSFFAIPVIFVSSLVYDFFAEFMLKGQTADNFFVSRENQISDLLFNFEQNPLLGNGFSVPVLPQRVYSLSLDYIVEPGNLFLSVLSYSGVFGFVLFAIYMLRILWAGRKKMTSNIYLFLAPILISMGEMVFFSSNSIGIWCYMFFALYMFARNNEEKEKIQNAL